MILLDNMPVLMHKIIQCWHIIYLICIYIYITHMWTIHLIYQQKMRWRHWWWDTTNSPTKPIFIYPYFAANVALILIYYTWLLRRVNARCRCQWRSTGHSRRSCPNQHHAQTNALDPCGDPCPPIRVFKTHPGTCDGDTVVWKWCLETQFAQGKGSSCSCCWGFSMTSAT